ncbi:MAG: hypothetical protein R3245_06165, partial [Kiloniellales bacterium]|nr:hypothetical protein [Kiloniellales bacterium]
MTLDRTSSQAGFARFTARLFFSSLQIADLLIVALCGLVSGWIRYHKFEIVGQTGLVIALVALTALVAFMKFDLYERTVILNRWAQVGRLLMAIAVVVLIVATIGYVTKSGQQISRLWAGSWLVSSVICLMAMRLFASHLFSVILASGALRKPVAVIALASEPERLERFLERWNARQYTDEKIVGIFFDDAANQGLEVADDEGVVRGDLLELRDCVKNYGVEHVIALLPATGEKPSASVLEQLRSLALDVDLVVTDLDSLWRDRPLVHVGGLPGLRIMSKPLGDWASFQKRAFDLLVSSLALVFFAPLMAL